MSCKNIAVIFAGGVGSRMKTFDGTPKQFLMIGNKTILEHTLLNFQNSDYVDGIVVVMLKDYIKKTQDICAKGGINKVLAIVEGGTTGQESIYHGLKAAKKYSDDDTVVLIHDGVRPIIDDDLIEKNVLSVRKYGSAISCAPSKETIVNITEDGMISNVVDRSKVWLARAPQSFFLKDILTAHEGFFEMGEKNMIDSCTMMKKAGYQLHVVETFAQNLKITTPEDYYVAKGLLAGNSGEYQHE
ncbi:2-C-methyl-D-erythritol 4-phosphate cytidylyltransferase [Candidatus Saccharibacteria bacterium]|nr:2-C-methyl-D-erythritol 4-phosphate cytidylyltransferase [Candidatus Saccharibacteria bacterium]